MSIPQPRTHQTQHPMWCDAWDPYRHREYIGHVLTKEHFNMLVSCDEQGRALHSVDAEGAGCLDAPSEIPCGSTLCIHTIGGYDRERYNRMPRETDDWKSRLRAEMKLGEMLKKILVETA